MALNLTARQIIARFILGVLIGAIGAAVLLTACYNPGARLAFEILFGVFLLIGTLVWCLNNV